MKRHGPSLPYDTAWALITLYTAPDEAALIRAWARENPGRPPGVHYDRWENLSEKERQRRRAWLRRHGHSPIQLLHLEAGLILSTGLYLLDWSLPPERTTQHNSTAQSQPDGRRQA
jgi:hypothetical protein